MGSEWERKRAEGFRKLLDKGLQQLGTPDLFTQQPEKAPRIVVADIAEGVRLQEGQTFVVQKIGNKLALLRGLQEVGCLSEPHSEIVSAVEKSFGVATGTIHAFHEDASIAEVSIC